MSNNNLQIFAVLLGGMSSLSCYVTVEQLTKYVLYCEWLIYATWRVTNSTSTLLQSIGACEKVFQMMDLLPSDQFLSRGKYSSLLFPSPSLHKSILLILLPTYVGVKLQRLMGSIQFVNVSFHYPTRIMVCFC